MSQRPRKTKAADKLRQSLASAERTVLAALRSERQAEDRLDQELARADRRADREGRA